MLTHKRTGSIEMAKCAEYQFDIISIKLNVVYCNELWALWLRRSKKVFRQSRYSCDRDKDKICSTRREGVHYLIGIMDTLTNYNDLLLFGYDVAA